MDESEKRPPEPPTFFLRTRPQSPASPGSPWAEARPAPQPVLAAALSRGSPRGEVKAPSGSARRLAMTSRPRHRPPHSDRRWKAECAREKSAEPGPACLHLRPKTNPPAPNFTPGLKDPLRHLETRNLAARNRAPSLDPAFFSGSRPQRACAGIQPMRPPWR